jgi:hypothetical protein
MHADFLVFGLVARVKLLSQDALKVFSASSLEPQA